MKVELKSDVDLWTGQRVQLAECSTGVVVGGPHDGERHSIENPPPQLVLQRLKPPKLCRWGTPNEVDKTVHYVHAQRYSPERGKVATFYYWGVGDPTPTAEKDRELFDLLLKWYHTGKNPAEEFSSSTTSFDLAIGGPLDGQVETKYQALVHGYKEASVDAGDHRFLYWRHSSIGKAEAVRLMFQNYHPPRAEALAA